MPDDDRIPSRTTAAWRKVIRCLRSRRPAAEAADAVALAAEGAYGTRELQDLFTEILASEQVSTLTKRWLERLDGVGLRAPSRQERVRRSLEDLVNTPIAELL